MEPSISLPSLESFGERLSWAMNKARPKLKNPDIAAVADTTSDTVSRWRGGGSVRGWRLVPIVALLRERGVPASVEWLGGEEAGHAQHDSGDGAERSKIERAWLARFRAELIELDATDAEMAAAEQLVQVPDLLTFARTHADEATPLSAMQWMGKIITDEIARRHGAHEVVAPEQLERALQDAVQRDAPDSEVLAILAELPLDRFLNVADIRAQVSATVLRSRVPGKRG